MFTATREGFFSTAFALAVDGQPVGRWQTNRWRRGGTLTLGGEAYTVHVSGLTSAHLWLTDAIGATVASVDRLKHRQWTVGMAGGRHVFRRRGWWSLNYDLVVGGQPAGFIRSRGAWSGSAEAELPGLPLPGQAFAVVVVLTIWAAAAAAAA